MTHRTESIYIGYDPRELPAYAVAVHSIRRRLSRRIPIRGLVLSDLQARGLYTRPTERVTVGGHSRLIDVLSRRPDYDGAISTEFAISRFLVPHLAREGWALFADCDMLGRRDLAAAFDHVDDQYAVMCVKHDHRPAETSKMDGQAQTQYARKNWSSVMLFNCDHPANQALTVAAINTLPGRDLHRLCWLDDSEIGELDLAFNWLAGHSDPAIDPCLVHHTDGSPCMAGYENAPFADEWRAELASWALSPAG